MARHGWILLERLKQIILGLSGKYKIQEWSRMYEMFIGPKCIIFKLVKNVKSLKVSVTWKFLNYFFYWYFNQNGLSGQGFDRQVLFGLALIVHCSALGLLLTSQSFPIVNIQPTGQHSIQWAKTTYWVFLPHHFHSARPLGQVESRYWCGCLSVSVCVRRLWTQIRYLWTQICHQWTQIHHHSPVPAPGYLVV